MVHVPYKGSPLQTQATVAGEVAMVFDSIRNLQHEIVKAIAARGMREEFATLGAEPIGSTPEELATTVQRDLRKWAIVARDSGVKAE
jgi:hypothetical protein